MIRNSKILMIVLPVTFLLLCYAAYEYGYTSLQVQVQETQELREQKEKMLYKYVAAISQKQQIQTTLHFLRPFRTANEEGVIKEKDSAKAAAVLQAVINEIVLQKGGVMSNEKVQAPEKAGAFAVIAMDMEALLPDTKALNEIVYAIETNPLYMVINSIDVRVNNKNNPRELAIKLNISALKSGQ